MSHVDSAIPLKMRSRLYKDENNNKTKSRHTRTKDTIQKGPDIKIHNDNEEPSSGEDHQHVDKLHQLTAIHRKMMRLQKENLELTNSIARTGAITSAAVKDLLTSAKTVHRLNGPQAPQPGPTISRALKPSSTSNYAKAVYFKVVFLRILDIDTLAEQFEAEVYIEARWQDPYYDGQSVEQLSKVEFWQCWDPQLKILNLVDKLDMSRQSMLLHYEADIASPVLVWMWHIRGVFREPMELQTFPFDVQELSIALSSELTVDQVELKADIRNDFYSSVNVGAMILNEEWRTYRHVQFKEDTIVREMDARRKYSVLIASAHVRRKFGSYFWNIVLVVLLILLLSFTLLAVEPFSIDRLTIALILFLTAVAFKLVVKESLPTISYLTYLDIYVVFSLVYLFLQGAEGAMMMHLATFKEPHKIKQYDEVAQALLITVMVLFHAGFVLYIQITVLKRRRKMARLDHAFKVKLFQKAAALKENQKAKITNKNKETKIQKQSKNRRVIK